MPEAQPAKRPATIGDGIRAGLPFGAAALLLGLSFGVVARPVMGGEAAIAMSVFVFAGAAVANEIALRDTPALTSRFGPTVVVAEPPACTAPLSVGSTAALALHFAWYNFVRVHRMLRVTPAMAAGVTERVWSLEELAA